MTLAEMRSRAERIHVPYWDKMDADQLWTNLFIQQCVPGLNHIETFIRIRGAFNPLQVPHEQRSLLFLEHVRPLTTPASIHTQAYMKLLEYTTALKYHYIRPERAEDPSYLRDVQAMLKIESTLKALQDGKIHARDDKVNSLLVRLHREYPEVDSYYRPPVLNLA
jgi:hypothetical protein